MPTPASHSRLGLKMYAHCPAVRSHSLHSSAACEEPRSSSCQYYLRLTASRKLEQFGGRGPNANALPSSANHLSRLSAAKRWGGAMLMYFNRSYIPRSRLCNCFIWLVSCWAARTSQPVQTPWGEVWMQVNLQTQVGHWKTCWRSHCYQLKCYKVEV